MHRNHGVCGGTTAQYDVAGLFGAVPLNATSYRGLEEGITGVQPSVFNQALQIGKG